ncbi:hypothetical protein [Mycobacteroides abscessus]|uniref:hypothetical protein n=1 Tax=Mycobacteroides abscessus TaxID=36809 RepID=UPI0009A676F3|nr:hypothetical protein [Mycobacteroides abscessus]SLH39177.1 Uncharacterised protein [Mycobacteroides abscessus subsp. massiliense]
MTNAEVFDMARSADLINGIRREAEAARAHISCWALDRYAMRAPADRIADALYAVALGIECDLRKVISKDLVDAQAFRALTGELGPPDDNTAVEVLQEGLNLENVRCFAVPVTGEHTRAVELGQIAAAIDNCASSARFILNTRTGRRRWPTELTTIAHQIRYIAASCRQTEPDIQ